MNGSKGFPKTVAMYLPQFHVIPENNMWWGEGYTEWTAVKAAKPLYEGHEQPQVPYNYNYYNLLDKSTMKWQAELAKEYGIYGFCFYHYWFENGMKILEKPAENLREWSDIKLPFCFCWANQTWARTWEDVRGANAWSDLYETKTGKVLMNQKYGRKEQWKEHLEYLLPFFIDERYIKINNRPVFIIYNSDGIPCLAEMLRFWNDMMKQKGLPDIYIIAENLSRDIAVDAVMQHKPSTSFTSKNAYYKDGLKCFDYEQLWEETLNVTEYSNLKQFFMGFTNFDDTPRRGIKGAVVQGFLVNVFEENIKKLYEKSIRNNSEIVFINAWNEWGEGMYMEPDIRNGMAVLEAHKRVVQSLKDNDVKKDFHKEKWECRTNRIAEYYVLLNQWMDLLEQNKSIISFFEKYHYQKVAIYGYGDLGKRLHKCLKGTKVEVSYIIDKRADVIANSLIKLPDKRLEKVDAIIITPYLEYEKIRNQLMNYIETDFVSIEEIIKEIL